MSDKPAKNPQAGSKPLTGLVPATTRFVYRNRRSFVRIALIPYGTVMLLGLLGEVLLATTSNVELEGFLHVLIFGIPVLQIFLITAFSTAWHRFTLSDGRDITPLGIRWGISEWRFLGYTILLVVIITVIFSAVVILDSLIFGENKGAIIVLAIPGTLGIAVFFMRWVLIFPAAAMGDTFSLGDSVSATRGNLWAMTGYYIILSLIVALLFAPVSLIINMLTGSVGFVYIVWETIVAAIGNAATISLLSLMYMGLTGRHQEPAPQEVTPPNA